MTPTTLSVFLSYAADAPNWSGTPLVGGNVGGSKEERGNLTQLKKAGYIETWAEEGCTWLRFTDAGKVLAEAYGINIGEQ